MKIVDAGQYVSLEGPDSGQVRCRITVRTDDGRQVSIPTSEDTVNKIIELMAGVTPQDAVDSEPLPSVMGPSMVRQNVEADYFGGNGDAASLGSIAEESPREVAPAPGLGQPLLDARGRPIAPRARTVAKDEYGYPIVQRNPDEPPPNEVFDEEDPGEQI